jgi:hypothetical protein
MLTIKDNKHVDIRPDWRAYFRSFHEQHEGLTHPPMHYRGRLLYSDGWTYSSTDYAGPEWAPPEDKDELHAMQLWYWSRRRWRILANIRDIRKELDAIKTVSSMHSAPLQQNVFYDEELPGGGKKRVKKAITLTHAVETFTEHLRRLLSEADQCDDKLGELKNAKG